MSASRDDRDTILPDEEREDTVADAPTELNPTTIGRWLVTTQGSTHTWDIRSDRVLYQRNPGQGRSNFTADGHTVTLTRIERWPAVGGTSLIYFDDLDVPELVEHWRQSSRIKSITRLPDSDDTTIDTSEDPA